MEFSKKLAVLSWVVTLILTFLSVILPPFGISIEGIHTALPYSWGEASVVQAFYIWKAKNENRHKYAMLYIDKIAERHGIEMALRFAEVVLNH